MIELDQVTKRYSNDITIGPVTFAIPTGGITALIGPNGAGKSTVLTMIGRLLSHDSGSISIGGHNISQTPSGELSKIVSILRQENHFLTRLTVRQLVGFGRFPYSRGRLTASDDALISRAIDFLGLPDLEQRYLDELSGGQRQRAYVAMVLAQDTDYVLLDEPLNNLDIQHSVQMMKHLRLAATELGRTIVIVLHDVNFASHYADRMCAVKAGQVTHFGTADELMTPSVLTSIFDTPVEVIETPRGKLADFYLCRR